MPGYRGMGPWPACVAKVATTSTTYTSFFFFFFFLLGHSSRHGAPPAACALTFSFLKIKTLKTTGCFLLYPRPFFLF